MWVERATVCKLDGRNYKVAKLGGIRVRVTLG